MAGMATETVSRTLSDFKDEGLIDKKGKRDHSACYYQAFKNEKLTSITFSTDAAHFGCALSGVILLPINHCK